MCFAILFLHTIPVHLCPWKSNVTKRTGIKTKLMLLSHLHAYTMCRPKWRHETDAFPVPRSMRTQQSGTPDKRPPQFKITLVKDHLMRDQPNDRPPWFKTTLMTDLPAKRPPWWDTPLVKDHFSKNFPCIVPSKQVWNLSPKAQLKQLK